MSDQPSLFDPSDDVDDERVVGIGCVAVPDVSSDDEHHIDDQIDPMQPDADLHLSMTR